ncbi:RING-box protein 1 [Zea mays]|uniref:RING-box protein 1 n=1 Tax=Zea mays TaxID=4577 RepID=A0A3L6DJG3_MAIZE|nr:RING-box protein 1 [Zea mays]
MSAMETDINAPPPAPAGEGSSVVGPSSSSSRKPNKRFEIKKWNAVALWAWDIVVDNCAICRNHIMDLCKFRASSARRTKLARPARSALSLGVSVIMLFTSTASAGGLRLAKCAH